jgi:hypothetical protein
MDRPGLSEREFRKWEMMKFQYLKFAAVALGLATTLGVTAAHAVTACPPPAGWGAARITSIVQDAPTFNSGNPQLGIEISYDLNAAKAYYYTSDYTDLNNNKARTLLQLISTAYTTQAPVIVNVWTNCSDTITLDSKVWVKNLKGLTLGGIAKPQP